MHNHLGLKPTTHRKHVRDYIDQDYIGLLSEEDKAWLNSFNNEYYKSFFPKNEEHLHNTTELKRAVYSAKNARNRDLYAIKMCSGMIYSDQDTTEVGKDTAEDDLIAILDYRNSKLKR